MSSVFASIKSLPASYKRSIANQPRKKTFAPINADAQVAVAPTPPTVRAAVTVRLKVVQITLDGGRLLLERQRLSSLANMVPDGGWLLGTQSSTKPTATIARNHSDFHSWGCRASS